MFDIKESLRKFSEYHGFTAGDIARMSGVDVEVVRATLNTDYLPKVSDKAKLKEMINSKGGIKAEEHLMSIKILNELGEDVSSDMDTKVREFMDTLVKSGLKVTIQGRL